jgi:thymidylate synthase (FAD)
VKIVRQSATLLQCTPEPCKLIEAAGRTCYKSECKITDDSAYEFVRMIVKRRHYSVIEHAVATFRIVTDRAIAQELTRHRLASYSMESTRYVSYGEDERGGELSFVAPSGMDSWQYAQWLESCRIAEMQYMQLIEQGARPEQARSVLPLCAKCELVMTANFREWMHVLKLRCNTAAHPEIATLCKIIGEQLSGECPEVFGEFINIRDKETNSGESD